MQFNNYKINLLKADDIEAFFKLINDNCPRLEDFFAGTLSENKTLTDAITYCKNVEQHIEDKSYFPFMITDTTTNHFVGLVDVKNIDWKIPKAELGSFIDKAYESKRHYN